MDSEKIKKLLPFLKDVDFEDENNKRKLKFALMVFVAVILGILLVIASMAKKDKENAGNVSAVDAIPGAAASYAEASRSDTPRSGLLEMPDGEDKDQVLNSADMISAREAQRKKRGTGLDDLYGRTSYGAEDDPMSQLTAEDDSRSSYDVDAAENARRAEAIRAKMRQAGSDQGSSAPLASESIEIPDQTKTRRIDAPSATASKRSSRAASSPKPSDPEPVEEDPDMGLDPEPEPAPEPERRQVRKSGGISSLDDWGSVDGIGGLDNDEQYVVVDDDKPVKVMFVREQKITTGSRVSLRLLDDIAADGMLIPKNTHLTAQCSIGERLDLRVNNIEINGKIITLGYTAFDNDGNEGLYCPQSAANKNTKEVKQNALSLGQSLLQSAVSGMGSVPGQIINSGSNIIRNSNGKIEAMVNAGYTFYLLKDNF